MTTRIYSTPQYLEIGTWRAMHYDAWREIDGLVWQRSLDGFGVPDREARHPRETWVLDLPGVGMLVKRNLKGTVQEESLWNPDFYGNGGYESFEEAARAAVRETVDGAYLQDEIRRYAYKLGEVAAARAFMRQSLIASSGSGIG